ncbi:MAG: hypothetical protein ACREX8_07360 [Gammaproteobacteria bacterium]
MRWRQEIRRLYIVAGEAFGEAVEQVYRWGEVVETGWEVLRWPLGLGALVAAVTALFRYVPRRRQPGLSWLAVGAGVTVLGLEAVRAGRIDPLLADTDGDGIPAQLDEHNTGSPRH